MISVFSDKDEEKVKSIELILNETRPDEKGSYTEENFIELLRKIDIGIFNVDGNTMCKRYLLQSNDEKLVPDNQSGEFEEIKKHEVVNCIIQGKVLL